MTVQKIIGLKKYSMEAVVFTVGAVVMVLELVGSRILAPYLGTSIFVWTSLIGIILGSLSIGYWKGGKMADKNPTHETLSSIIFVSSVLIALDIILKPTLFSLLYNNLEDIRMESIVAALLLFAPSSILLGMVSPYAVKLKMKSVADSGSTVGNLYAISTIGSIVGTFLAGFFLISYFSNTALLLLLSATLLAASFIVWPDYRSKFKMVFAIFLLFSMLGGDSTLASLYQKGVIDIDTTYNKVWIMNSVEGGKEARFLVLNKESNSAMFLDDTELVFNYTKFYRLGGHFKPDLKNSLMLGGGAYSYPKDYLEKFPEAKIDVVEIDPALTDIARKYFNLENDPRLAIYHEDARTYLNKTEKKYDVIFGDAFKSLYSIPYQLTTLEATEKIYGALNNDGVAIVNIISSPEGAKSDFLRAEYATYKAVFPQVYVLPVENASDGEFLQNIMLVALKSEAKPSFKSDNPELNSYLGHLWTKEIKTDLPVLTDDFAPVDQYMMKII